jgi:hypothetical protein
MSTIRTIPPETGTSGPVVSPDTIHPSTPPKEPKHSSITDPTHAPVSTTPPRSATSTPTTTATLTPNGRHRAIPVVPVSQQRLSTHNPSHGYPRRSRRPQPRHGDGEDGEFVANPQDWMEVKKSWWKRVWSWIRGWGFR